MPFAYFERLSRPEQAAYLVSDAFAAIALPRPAELRERVLRVEQALASGEVARIAEALEGLAAAMLEQLEVAPVDLTVFEVRPRRPGAELHGLYTRALEEGAQRPRVHVWMRTAAHRRVVAFRTFLHELCHHLDYELLSLPVSFHTEGFFKRESSLFHQLVPGARGGGRSPPAAEPRRVH